MCRDIEAADPVYFTAAVPDGDGPLFRRGESAMTSGEYIGAPRPWATDRVWAGFVSLAQNAGGIAVCMGPVSAMV